MGDTFSIQRVDYKEDIEPIQTIRRQVFQFEQGVSPELEFDGHDEAAIHFLAYQGNEAIGTARIRYLTTNNVNTDDANADDSKIIAKIERVAVLAEHRGNGIGKRLMEVAIAYLYSQGITAIKINAQLQAQTFYEQLKFTARGSNVEEAGIPYIEMWYAPI
ncbi:MAG: GNAT family N-acetyltransferase [Cyanobacteria bacterium P01_F01_bin.150]